MMDIHPLKTEQDYDAALQAIEALWEAPKGSPEADSLEILVHLHRSVCAFPWERHAPAWLLEPGWSPAFPGTKALAQELLRKCTSVPLIFD